MLAKPNLSPDFCVHVVVSATPFPSRYKPGTPDTTKLFDLGVVDDVQRAHFINGVKSGIFPWLIDDSLVASSRDTTVQASAASVMTNAK
jgi:hypothetical protein